MAETKTDKTELERMAGEWDADAGAVENALAEGEFRSFKQAIRQGRRRFAAISERLHKGAKPGPAAALIAAAQRWRRLEGPIRRRLDEIRDALEQARILRENDKKIANGYQLGPSQIGNHLRVVAR